MTAEQVFIVMLFIGIVCIVAAVVEGRIDVRNGPLRIIFPHIPSIKRQVMLGTLGGILVIVAVGSFLVQGKGRVPDKAAQAQATAQVTPTQPSVIITPNPAIASALPTSLSPSPVSNSRAQVVTPSCDPEPIERFKAEYFNNRFLDGASVLTRCEPAIEHYWGSGSPDERVNAEMFSARWRGKFYFNKAGIFTFLATSDDGIRVWIDGQKVIDAWVDRTKADHISLPQELEPGYHEIFVEYFENTGIAVAKVWWVEGIPVAKVENLGLWNGELSRPLPPPADPGQAIIAHGDITSSGRCNVRVFRQGQPLVRLGTGTFRLLRVTGLEAVIQQEVEKAQASAAQDARQDCPLLQ